MKVGDLVRMRDETLVSNSVGLVVARARDSEEERRRGPPRIGVVWAGENWVDVARVDWLKVISKARQNDLHT